MRLFILCAIGVSFLLSGCKTTEQLLQTEQSFQTFALQELPKEKCNCEDLNHYRPDPRYPQLNPWRTLRVSVHFTNRSDRSQNHSGKDAILYATGLINDANSRMGKNEKMRLPHGNHTPVYDPRIRYELAEDPSTPSGYAIYEDIDDDLYYFINKGKNRNNYKRKVIKTYAKDDDKVLNIFAMPHHPDSLASPNYRGGLAGIALGTSVKVGGSNEHGAHEAWRMGTNLNHEIGHVLGLRHSWIKNDYCDDTPRHDNCWDEFGPNCKGKTSNNMMDYNNVQMAITPCQIGIMHRSLSVKGKDTRGLLYEDYCFYDEDETLVVKDELHIDRELDMYGDIIVKKKGYLTLSCRLHMPAGASIIVKPGGTLELNGATIHNDCGEQWEGIKLIKKGKKEGQLIIRSESIIRDVNGMESEEALF